MHRTMWHLSPRVGSKKVTRAILISLAPKSAVDCWSNVVFSLCSFNHCVYLHRFWDTLLLAQPRKGLCRSGVYQRLPLVQRW